MTGRLERCIKEARKVGLNGKRVLDIGCSFGWFCEVAVRDGTKEVWGIDPNKEQIKKAKKEVKGAKFKVAHAGKLPFVNNKFDLITLFDVIEHVPKSTEPQTLSEAARVLKKGGYLIISTPYNNLFATLTDPAWYFGHRHYSKEDMSRLLKIAGFNIISSKVRGGIWEIIGMNVLYFSKWILRMKKMPFEEWFDVRRRREFNKSGFTHLMVISQKI